MAWTHSSGARSGKHFERNVYVKLAGATDTDEDGVILQRDSGVQQWQVAEALNDSLREVYMRAVEASDRNGVERLTAIHDVTYPVGVEFVALDAALVPEGTPPLVPTLPRAYFDIRKVFDRTRRPRPPVEIPTLDVSAFHQGSGLRWSFAHGCLYLADGGISTGPRQAYDLRIMWVPAPAPIDIASEQQRTDIPVELHKSIELGAVRSLMVDSRAEEIAALDREYERALKIALRSFGQVVKAPRYMVNTRYRGI